MNIKKEHIYVCIYIYIYVYICTSVLLLISIRINGKFDQDALHHIVGSTVWKKYFKQPMQDKMHCRTELLAQCAWSTSSIQYTTRCTAQSTISAYQAQQRARMKSQAKKDPKGKE